MIIMLSLRLIIGDTPLHIAAANGRADVITALTLPLTKQEVKHPYYKCPYKSLPQDNVNSYNHDGRVPVHLAAAVPESLKHREAVAALSMYAKCNMDYRVSRLLSFKICYIFGKHIHYYYVIYILQ